MAQTAIDETDEFEAGLVPDPNEHRHIYEHKSDGTQKALVINKHHVPIEAAAEQLDIDPDEWSWVFTEGHAINGSASGAIPCTNCDGPIWKSRQRANEVKNSDRWTVRCGACASERDEDDR